jgi:hypothetical protein
MRHRNQRVPHVAGQGGCKRCTEVQRHLVAKKIKVHPGAGAASFLTTQYAPVKTTGYVKVGDMDGEVKEALHSALG